MTNKSHGLRAAEALAARLVSWAEAPAVEVNDQATEALLRDVLAIGTMDPLVEEFSMSVADMAAFQRTLQAFIRRILDNPRGRLLMFHLRLAFGIAADGRRAVVAVGGPTRDVLLLKMITLVEQVGLARFQRCDCGRTYIKNGRREFCSERCQNRIWMRAERQRARTPRQTPAPDRKARKNDGNTTRTR